jgi:hypothetical protein
MKRPATLMIGVILQWAAGIVGVFAGLDLMEAALTMSREGVGDQLEATLRANGIEDIAGSLLIVGVFIAGVALGALALLRIVFAGYVWQGRSWARVILTVLIALNIVTGVAYFVEGYVLRMLLTVPVDVLVLWLIFERRSSAYIAYKSKSPTEELAAAP